MSILRTEMLQPSELQALFGEDKDYSCSLTEIVHHTECEQPSDCENTAESVCEFSSLSDPDCCQSCTVSHLQRQVPNQEYYTKLQELEREHMKNIDELEKLYLNQLTPGQKERQPVSSRRERQISTNKRNKGQKESEQGELTQVGSKVSAARPKTAVSNLNLKQSQQNSFEELRKPTCPQQKPFDNIANLVKDKTQGTMETLRQNSKGTIPKPFHMMLREEGRKRRNVKTRSEMALENERLRRELDELKEFGKRFRAKPAPASTHMLLYENIINKRLNKHQMVQNHSRHQLGRKHCAPSLPQKPFSFIERERKKKEKKLAEDISNLTGKEERKIFKARPVPKSLYRPVSPNYQMYEGESMNTRERQSGRCSVLSPSIQEDILQEEEMKEYPNEFSSSLWKWKSKGVLKMEEELERKKNRERDWSYIHPLRRSSICHSQELSHTGKSDYISV